MLAYCGLFCYNKQMKRERRLVVVNETGNNTIYEVAKEAGVSITTVSRVLHGKDTVSPKTRQKVEAVIKQLNYRPSAIARGLTGQKTNTLGIILPKLTNPNYALIFNGAYEEARKHGYAVSLFPWSSLSAEDYNPALMLAERRLDGVIINVEYLAPEDAVLLERELKELHQYMPVVLIGCVPQTLEYPTINYKYSEWMQKIVGELTALGHERIAFIGGAEGDRYDFRRDVGYAAGLKEARLPFVGNYRIYCKATAEAGENAMREMLESLQPRYWPTAVIAINDMVAIGCQKVAFRYGLRIPQDMSIVGCDNLFFASFNNPPLSTVDTKQQELGARAVRKLLSGDGSRENAEWELILRESIGKAADPVSDTE